MAEKDRTRRLFQLLKGGGDEAGRGEEGVPRLVIPGAEEAGIERARFARRLSPRGFRILADILRAKQEESRECRVLKEICQELGGISCHLYLWNDEARKLVVCYYFGVPQAELWSPKELDLGEGYPGLVAVHGHPVVTSNLQDPRTLLRFDRAGAHPGFYAAIPLVSGDTLFGVLQVVSPKESPVHWYSPDLLPFMGRMLAMHLEKDVLQKEMKREGGRAYTLSDHILTELSLFLDARPQGQWDPEAEDRVAILTVALLRRLDWEVADWREVRWLCRLRDIGMFVVAPEVLRQPGPLTSQQREAVRKHPEVAYRFFERLPVSQAVLDMVRHHHERYDGQGYPAGLAGDDIPRLARVVAVADAYNSMVSSRPYRAPRTPREAMDEIERCAGTQFDPEVAEACVGILAEALSRMG